MALGFHIDRGRARHGRRCLVAGLAAAVASGLAVTGPARAAGPEITPAAAPSPAPAVDGPADGLIVRFDDAASARSVERAVTAAGGTIEAVGDGDGLVRISTGSSPPEAVQAALAASAVVDVVEPNRIRRAAAVPNDPAYGNGAAACFGCPSQQSYLQAMRLPEAWDTTTGNDSMVLAVLDSGVEFGHPDLVGRLWLNTREVCGNRVDDDRNGFADDCRGWDFVDNDASPDDEMPMGHGTIVVGAAGAASQNGRGVAGVTWQGRIMPVRVLDAGGSASDFDIARGIRYAVDNGATVINLSLGSPGPSKLLQDAVNYATSRNVVVVAAAGNDGMEGVAAATEPHYPAACDGVIAVGATTASGAHAEFSSYGSPSNPWVDVVAPGATDSRLGIMSTVPVRSYGHRHGTSFSSPLVAAVAFLMRSADPNASQSTITSRLVATARDLGPPGFDPVFGAGMVDANAAVASMSGNFSTASVNGSGYWMLGERGAVYRFGGARHLGDVTAHLSGGATAADLEPTPSGAGYWIVDTAGNVFAFGDAGPRHYGGAGGRLRAGEQVTSLSATRHGNGYWLFTTAGRVFAFGDATWLGDLGHLSLNGPILDSIPTPLGQGYFMVGSDGGIFAFGDAPFLGSMGGRRLNAPVQSLVPDPDRSGYWLVASDGGVFAFGGAPFRGSMGGTRLNAPVAGMVPFGNGYLMVASDGGAFNFSNEMFSGSLVGSGANQPVISIAAKAPAG